MSPGVGHEAGETARTVVEALKTTPMALALVVFNLAFIGLIGYLQHTNGERWQELLKTTLQQCGPK